MQGSHEEERLRALLRHVSETISIFDANGTLLWLGGNPGGTLGRADDAWVGENAFDHIHPDDRDLVLTKLAEVLERPDEEVVADFRARRADGTWVYLEGIAVNRLDDPLIGGIVLTSRNISERKRTERFLQQQTGILERIASGAPIDSTLAEIVDLVQDGIADSFCTVALDLPGSAHVDDPWCRMVSGADENVNFGLLVVAVDQPRPPTAKESAVMDAAGNLASIAVERSRSEERLRQMALHDPLTGLPNRTLLLDHLATALRRISRHRTPVAVLFLDIDGFKKLNDSLGHYAGDLMLREVANRLDSVVRPGDTVARFAGDEFVILCEQVVDEAHAQAIAERVEQALESPFHIHGTEVVVSASIGIALSSSPDDTANRLLHEADTAMYKTKNHRRARAALFGVR